MRRVRSEVPGPERRRRAVRIAEVRDRAGNVLVEVPAAAAGEGRLQAECCDPPALLAHESGRVALRRPCVVGCGPVRVQPEGPTLAGLARALEPALLVL